MQSPFSRTNYGYKSLNCLHYFRCVVESDPHVKGCKLDDAFLVLFLRSAQYRVKEAKENLINYVQQIRDKPDLFCVPDDVQSLVESNIAQMSKSSTTKHDIIMFKVSNWNLNQMNTEKVVQMLILSVMLSEKGQKNGIHLVMDCSDVGVRQLYSIGFSDGLLSFDFLYTILPIRVLKVHIIRASKVVRGLGKWVIPLLGGDLSDRIIFHDDQDLRDLHRCCPASSLLPEFTGTAEQSYSTEDYVNMIEARRTIMENTWNSIKSNLPSDS
ncbi:alpha-tocopherol transfer protein-like [Brevipalpus obovatus]|uniref:alpha-tocopherol transfer protein-like n=1 Tax=Brevipalpus obovatus TaxID=246614 RepID=UPI003D9E0E4E